MNWKFLRCWNVLVVLGAIGVSLTISAQPAWINDGLVAYYPFDDNIDSPLTGLDELTVNVSSGRDRFNTPNGAVGFDTYEGSSALQNLG
jgi:hypothetical protein